MRRRSRLLVALLVVVVALAALTFALFVRPRTDPPARVDAVVVFAGGDGERQAEGVRLVRAGTAPVLVLSVGGDAASRRYQACRQPPGFRVVCLSPSPATTNGESRAFADLARREGWRSLAMVTSTFHLRRASLQLGRCYDGRVFTVATPVHVDRADEPPMLLLHEWAGLLSALTVDRAC
jgi:uncharacterized SAM-binding protein YcdF (DUF218 family)